MYACVKFIIIYCVRARRRSASHTKNKKIRRHLIRFLLDIARSRECPSKEVFVLRGSFISEKLCVDQCSSVSVLHLRRFREKFHSKYVAIRKRKEKNSLRKIVWCDWKIRKIWKNIYVVAVLSNSTCRGKRPRTFINRRQRLLPTLLRPESLRELLFLVTVATPVRALACGEGSRF